MPKLSDFVNRDRLMARHFELGKVGAIKTGGVNRQALSDEDNQARLLVMRWAEDLGADTKVDAIGNIFLRLNGSDPESPAIATGSHLDTQPCGGMFDGIYGVLAGLEVMEAVDASGKPLSCDLDLIIWQNEEGSRFAPATMGSGVYSGELVLEDLLRLSDSKGIVFKDALESMHLAFGDIEKQQFPASYDAYIEAHIEQGPILEDSQSSVGVVTSIQGLRQYQVTVTGQAAHAGTTPESQRKDALMSTIDLISNMNNSINDKGDKLRFTVGSLDVKPGSPNTIPSEVIFSIDLRYPGDNRLDDIEKIVFQAVDNVKLCTANVKCLIRSAVTHFDESLVDLIDSTAKELKFSAKKLSSGATHDAKSMAKLCPCAMIFVPCKDGISHNKNEWAEPEDLWAGACVLADVISARSKSISHT